MILISALHSYFHENLGFEVFIPIGLLSNSVFRSKIFIIYYNLFVNYSFKAPVVIPFINSRDINTKTINKGTIDMTYPAISGP